MCLYEYDEEKHMEMERREHYERGLADGIAQGEKRGRKEGERIGEPFSYIFEVLLCFDTNLKIHIFVQNNQ